MQVDINFSRASSLVRSAAAQGATLAVLPEYCLTGFRPSHADFPATTGQWQSQLQRFQDLARECAICLVPGSIVRRIEDADDKRGYTLSNVSSFIDDKGVIRGSYGKKNVWCSNLSLPYSAQCI